MKSVLLIVFVSCLLISTIIGQDDADGKLFCNRKELLDVTDEEQARVTNVTMLMTISERVMLLREMSKVQSYFEFGAGGSTEIACQLPSLQTISTVDNNFNFLSHLVNTSTCIPNAILESRLSALYVDIGPIGDFGNPLNNTDTDLWHTYPTSILNYNGQRPQLVLIDGRFRVASALMTLLTLQPNSRMLFHDFLDRPHYYRILNYVDVIDCVDSLVILQRKANIQWMELFKDIDFYVKDFR